MKRTFAELFKKHRLRAEFEKLSELGDALSEKGMYYEDSIFSHWQKGTRIPHERKVVLTLISLFTERKAINSIDEANAFLESTNQGYLTENELKQLSLLYEKKQPVFQLPNDLTNFTGRKQFFTQINQQLKNKHIIFIHGQPGVGKTSLAIKLGYRFCNQFPDGVLWYKVTSSRISDILLSIAATFGEDISHIEDIEIRASVVRSLLSNKKILIILDSLDDQRNLHLLLPNSKSCLIIITSRNNTLQTLGSYLDIPLSSFTGEEVLQLFGAFFNQKFINEHQHTFLAIGEKVGNLPLALLILVKQLKKLNYSPEKFLSMLNKESISLTELSYEEKNLSLAIELSYDQLSSDEKKVFISLGIFEGKDFSLEAVAAINNLSLSVTENTLNNIFNTSLIEISNFYRYRIHTMIRQFAKEKITDDKLYLLAAKYFESYIFEINNKKDFKHFLKQETDNIIAIFNQCYRLGYWDDVTKLWHIIEIYIDPLQQKNKIIPLIEHEDTTPKLNILQKILLFILSINSIAWLLLAGSGLQISFWNYFYSLMYSFIPAVGGIIGIVIARQWGIKKSTLGKAILFISLGLLSWGIGNLTWAYYNFFDNISVPYPSLADAGYFLACPLWTIGIIYISYATGIKFGLKNKFGKFLFGIIPLIVAISSYYFLFAVEKKGFITNINQFSLRFFLDFAYPTNDIIILTLVLIILGISFKFFGGKYKLSLSSILVGFALMYIADFLFSFTNSNNTYYTGNISDFFFSIALSFITLGIWGFYLRNYKASENI